MTTAALATHEPRSLPTFRERISALVGVSGWREPVEGRTTQVRPIPGQHMTVAALSMARRGPDDIGPDIAFDVLTGRLGHATKVCRWLGRQLAPQGGHAAGIPMAARRCRDHIGLIAVIAYRYEVLREPFPPAPEGVTADDWGTMLIFAALMLEYAAEDAIAMAERMQRGGA